MIKNPIQEVTSKLQCRAIGIIYGVYKPNESTLINKGQLTDTDGIVLDCVVLGKTLPIMKKFINFEKNYFWIVYPRNKDSETLHFQITGVWEPLKDKVNASSITQEAKKKLYSLNLKDNFFSIRGQLIYINKIQKELVIKVFISKVSKKSKNKPFKITIKGEISMDYVNSFVSINSFREGNSLHMDSYEIIETDYSDKKLV